MNVGDKKDIKLKFPKDYYSAELAGKPVTFTTTLKSIVKKTAPKLDDEFVKSVSKKSKTVDEYKAEVKKDLEKEQKDSNLRTEKYNLVSKAATETKMKKDKKGNDLYPEDVLNEMVEEQLESYKQYAKQQNMTLEDFIQQQTGSTLKDFKKQLKQSSKSTLKQDLVVSAIGRQEGVKIKNKDIDAFIKDYLKDAGMTEEQFEKQYGKPFKEYIGEKTLYSYVLSDKVENILYDIAKKNTEEKAKKSEKKEPQKVDKEKKSDSSATNSSAKLVKDSVDEVANAVNDVSKEAAKKAEESN